MKRFALFLCLVAAAALPVFSQAPKHAFPNASIHLFQSYAEDPNARDFVGQNVAPTFFPVPGTYRVYVDNTGVLKHIDSNGVVTTLSGGGGGSPGGATTNVQLNDAGAFFGKASFTFNKTTDVLSLTGSINVPTITNTAASQLAINSSAGQRISLGVNGAANTWFFTFPGNFEPGANAASSVGSSSAELLGAHTQNLYLYGTSSGAITVKGAAAAGTWTFTLPTSGGNNGDVLTTNGSGVASWVAPTTDAPITPQYVTLATDATLTNERVLTAGTGIAVTDAGAGSTVTVARRGQNGFIYLFDDFLGGTGGSSPTFVTNVSGTGATIATNVTVDPGGHPGIANFTMGSTTTGRVALQLQPGSILFGNGAATFEADVLFEAVSDGTDTYTSRTGFLDTTSSDPVDGAYVRYTHSVNSGKFEYVTRSNSSETAIDSGVTVAANTWYRITVTVNAAGSSVTFLINGANSGTQTLTIPTGASRQTGAGVCMVKSAGTSSAKQLDCDYMLFTVDLTTPR